MQTLETLKRSIRSASDLGSVVRTMKTLAAVSIRQYETAVVALESYARTINLGLQMVLSTTPQRLQDHSDATAGRTGGLIFGSDQGMCGQFNLQIADYTAEILRTADNPSELPPVLCVGQRVAEAVTQNGLRVEHTLALPGSVTGITLLVQDLLPALDQWRQRWRIGRILVFHNQRLSAAAWRPAHQHLLPLQPEDFRQQQKQSEVGDRSLPTWTMDTSALFSQLVTEYLFVSLFRACAESLAGENASRIAAMQAAERNIDQRLQDLQSAYGQRRQTSITEELLDVVTGYEALQQSAES